MCSRMAVDSGIMVTGEDGTGIVTDGRGGPNLGNAKRSGDRL